jgi:hypothetical protein
LGNVGVSTVRTAERSDISTYFNGLKARVARANARLSASVLRRLEAGAAVRRLKNVLYFPHGKDPPARFGVGRRWEREEGKRA